MPVMTKPLAHLEMLLDDTKAKIEALNIERLKLEARIHALNEVRWEVSSVLDEERKKLDQPCGDGERS